MAINTYITDNPTIMQYGAYGRIDGDSNYPAVTSYRNRYPDASQAYDNTGQPVLTAFDVQLFPRYAMLTYNVNPTTVTLSGASITTNPNVVLSAGVVVPNEALLLPGSTAITALTGSGYFQKMWIYPISGFSAGVPQLNSGNIYVGKSGIGAANKYLPDVVTPSGGAFSIILPTGQQMAVTQVIVKLTTSTDGVFYNWT